MTKLFLVSLLFFCAFIMKAQSQFAYKIDRFSGINGASIEPTHQLLNDNLWDLNLIGIDAYLHNDYAYISNQNFLGLFHEDILGISIKKARYGTNTPHVLDYNAENKFTIATNIEVAGPAFAYRFKVKEYPISIGFFTKARAMVNSFQLDRGFKNYNFLSPNYTNTFQVGKGKIAVASWSEVGLNLATQLSEDNSFTRVLVGANFKLLNGYDAAIINNKSPLSMNLIKDTLDAAHFDVEASFASSYDFKKKEYTGNTTGKGFSGDLGITFVQGGHSGDVDFNSKLSINVLDVGLMKYTGEKHLLKGDFLIDFPHIDLKGKTDPQFYLRTLSQNIYGDSLASTVGKDFVVAMPSRFSINYSKKIRENEYLHLDWTQRFVLHENALKYPNSLTASYSVEKNIIGYGASVSMFEYVSPQIGGYFRFGPFYIGSDNMLPIVIDQKKLQSFDLYFGIKINPFWDTEMTRRGRDCNCGK